MEGPRTNEITAVPLTRSSRSGDNLRVPIGQDEQKDCFTYVTGSSRSFLGARIE